ncbi:MAG: putative LPS assembly protein LptD [Luteibaculum sp.]
MITTLVFNQAVYAQQDTGSAVLQNAADSLKLPGDSLAENTKDTLPKKIGNLYLPEDDPFESEVVYNAKDSIKYDLKNKRVLLYGEGKVTYGSIELTADYIEYGFTTNQVLATPVSDTAGKPIGIPVFADDGQKYQADTIRYNFKTRQGIIKKVSTQIADGHVYGKTVKRTSDNVLYIESAEFCPCENKDAKTRIHANKLKVIPNDKIVSSSWVLKLGKIPTPLAFFFGYFPNNSKKSAGIVLPRYGDDPQRGFFLQDFGWYQPLGEKADLKLLGSVFTRGSWNTSADMRYKSIYRYNGNFNFFYQRNRTGFVELPNSYQETTNFSLNWNHSQDAKARPNSTFRSSVNLASRGNNRNRVGVSSQEYLTNTLRSNINYSRSFTGKPYTFAATASHSQNTNTGQVNISLPQLTFNMSRVYLPLGFLKAEGNGKTMWYEKIGLNYSANFSNQISTYDSLISARNINFLRSQMQNGIRHNATMSTSLKKWFFTINPSVDLTSRNYFRRINKRFDNETQETITDTIPGFYNVYDYGFNTSVTTNLYGMFTYKKGPVKAIRHLITPTANFFYRPGNDYRQFGFFGNNGEYQSYTPYDGAIYGVPSPNESAGLGLNLQNNLEAKIRDRKDTTGTGTKKIKLLEALNFSSNHDFLRDSIKWSPINMQARTNLIQTLSLNYNATLDPYGYDGTGQQVNESLIKQRDQLLRVANQNFALTYSYRPGMYKNKDEKEKKDSSFVSTLYYGIKPDISISYNYTISQNFDTDKGRFENVESPNTITVSGSIDFFSKVQIRYSTGYDFIAKKVPFTQFNVYVDLNCWEFSANFVPFGNVRSYSVALNMKSALLKDVKLERNRTFQEF